MSGPCGMCQGLGGSWDHYDPSPQGVEGLPPGYHIREWGWTECPGCLVKGRCPWCMSEIHLCRRCCALECTRCPWDDEKANKRPPPPGQPFTDDEIPF